jgi:hypothetical protein
MTTDEDTSSSLVLCSVKLLDIPCRRGLAKDDHLVDPAAEVLALDAIVRSVDEKRWIAVEW